MAYKPPKGVPRKPMRLQRRKRKVLKLNKRIRGIKRCINL